MKDKDFYKGVEKLGKGTTRFLTTKELQEIIDKEKDSLIRTSLVVSNKTFNKVKDIAYWERLKIQDVVNNALKDYIEKYELANGEIKPKV